MEQFFVHANLIVIFTIYAVSLNLLLGYTGQLSVAHAAFGAVGAYSAGYLAVIQGWSFLPAFSLGLGAACIVGLLTGLPALYLDARYLILLTLAFSMAVLAVIGAVPELGGSLGLIGIPRPEIFGRTFAQPSEFFQLAIVLALVVLVICWRLAYSPFGRVLRGIRDDELATRGLGKNVLFYKALVFAVTAGMAGIAGMLFAYFHSAAQPGAFDLAQSLAIIAIVVIGGTANLMGSIVGATLLVLLTPFLEDVIQMAPVDAAHARLTLYGALIALFLLVRPEGLIPERWTMRATARWLSERSRGRPQPSPAEAPSGPFVEPNAVRSQAGNREEPRAPRAALETLVTSQPPLRDNGGAEPVLEASDLSKRFNGIRAADGLSMRLFLGHVTGLIGPNGAGKTTIFNLLTSVVPPDEGNIRLGNDDITGWTLNRIAKAGIARSYQDVRVYPRMSVLENVMIAVPDQSGEHFGNAIFRPIHTSRTDAEVRAKALAHLDFVGLVDRAHEFTSSLSFAEQKLVALARLLATEAEVLLLDEPTSGLDIDWVERVLVLIAELRAQGKCICIVEHNLHAVERVADWIYFMENGRITAEGTMRELMAEERLAEVYFGSA